MSAMSTWPNVIWGSNTVRMGYFAWRRFFGGCPALIRINLFLVAKAVLVGQNDPDRAFLTRIFKSTGAL